MNIKDQKFIDMITEIKAKIVRYHPDLEKEFDWMIFQITHEDYTAAFFYIMRFLEWAIGIIYADICHISKGPIICDEYDCKKLMREHNKKQSKTDQRVGYRQKYRIYIRTSVLYQVVSKDSKPDTFCYSEFEHKNGRTRTLSLSEQLDDITNSWEMNEESLTGYVDYTDEQGILDLNEKDYASGKCSKEAYLRIKKEFGEMVANNGKFSHKSMAHNSKRIQELNRINLEIVKSKILLDQNEKDYASGKILEQEYLKAKRKFRDSKKELEQKAKEYDADSKLCKEILEWLEPKRQEAFEDAKKFMGPTVAKQMFPNQNKPRPVAKTLEEVSKRIAEIDGIDDQYRSLELIEEIRTEKMKKRLKKITFSQKVLQLLQYLRKKQRNVTFHQVNSYVDHNEMINSVYVMDEIADKFDVILMDDTSQILSRRRKEANYSKSKTRNLKLS